MLKIGHGLELYDLQNAPNEREDLSRREGMWRVIRNLIHLLEEEKKQDHSILEAHHRLAGRRKFKQDPEAAERLRKLGYAR